jgi:integral membrane protein (TIGR01906 family)
MKHMKHHDKIIIIILSIVLFIIIIFGSLNFMIFNKDFYYKEYSKNDVYDRLPKNIETENITNNMLSYFHNRDELRYFSDIEKSHMGDVKQLIRTMQFIYYGAALLCVALFIYAYKIFRDDQYRFIKIISKAALYSSIVSITFLVILFLMSVFSFNFLFTVFHLIFFSQGNWMFSPDSLLITLFPQQFFFDISLRIFVYAMFQSLMFFALGYWMRKQLKIVEKYHH